MKKILLFVACALLVNVAVANDHECERRHNHGGFGYYHHHHEYMRHHHRYDSRL